jgi:hypothetical protein
MTRLSRYSLFREKKKISNNHDNREAIIAISRSLLGPLRPYIPSTALCPVYGPMSRLFPLRPSLPSMALCPFYGPLSPLRPSVPLWPSVPSTTLCPLWKERNKRNGPLVSRNVLQNAFCQYSKGYRDLFRISDNRDYRNNHDYHSSEILSDNCKIAIIVLAKKVAIIAIITSIKKR